MEEKVVKLGVVGLGRGASVVSEILHEKNVKLTAICDKNPKKIEEALERLKEAENLEVYDNFDDIIKSDIDAIYIATDAIYHVPYVIKALDAGKHVLSEIPAVNTIEEAKQLKAAVKAHPELKYMAGENCCYWGFIQTWKKLYEDGRLGEAIYAEGEYIHSRDYREYKEEDFPKDHWRTFAPAIKYLTHELGPLLYIMNDKCVSVSCMVPDVKYNPYRETPYNGVAIFKTAKGAVIKILICFDAYVGFDHNFTLIGTRGTIETDRVKTVKEAYSYARFSDVPGTLDAKVEIPVGTAFYGEKVAKNHGGCDKKMMEAFIKCIIEDTEPPIDVDMGINMAIPGVIADESSKQGGALLEIPEI